MFLHLSSPPFFVHSLLLDSPFFTQAGDLLFVPADCPHFVANLDDALAISCNFIDASNAARALSALDEQGWSDASLPPLAAALRDALSARGDAAGERTHTPYRDMANAGSPAQAPPKSQAGAEQKRGEFQIH